MASFGFITNTGRAGPGTTSAIDTTGAMLLILGVGDGSGSSPVPTDSKNNQWAPLLEVQSGVSFFRAQMWCVMNPIVGSGHTFTVATDQLSFSVAAFGGLATPGGQQGGGGPDIDFTPSESNCLLVTNCVCDGTGDPASIGAGFTITNHFAGVVGVNAGQGLAYLIQTALTTVNTAWTVGAVDSGSAIVEFRKRAAPHAGYVAPILKF